MGPDERREKLLLQFGFKLNILFWFQPLSEEQVQQLESSVGFSQRKVGVSPSLGRARAAVRSFRSKTQCKGGVPMHQDLPLENRGQNRHGEHLQTDSDLLGPRNKTYPLHPIPTFSVYDVDPPLKKEAFTLENQVFPKIP